MFVKRNTSVEYFPNWKWNFSSDRRKKSTIYYYQFFRDLIYLGTFRLNFPRRKIYETFPVAWKLVPGPNKNSVAVNLPSLDAFLY